MDKKKMLVLGLVVAAAAGVFAYYYLARYFDQGLTASGTIEATEVVVSSKVPGRILKLNCDEGDTIKQGAVIAQIDPVDTKAALRNAQARYDEAKNDYNRAHQLFSSSMISAQQHDAAKANYAAAQAAFVQAKDGFNNTEISAPLNGTVLVKAVEVGELANFGTPIVVMANLETLKLIVYLGEKEIGQIKLGDPVKVTVDAYPDQAFTGKITHIADKAEFTPKAIQTKDERTTLVFGIKVEIPNPGQKLKPGMPADAVF
ncbi:MAG: efflux RND transporter periplasmic adaptor subunit [Candidatus Margulisbacteria bacterium]|jgi:RND family efflux transporter MFP subunit|nr:efflux RND transporter periplasmic adaptor subunit [Candidatus Margulisiibacteriota bacterium]